MVPADDPIWWFVRSPAEELWLSEVIMEYPQTNMFGEEVPNMLQVGLADRLCSLCFLHGVYFLFSCSSSYYLENQMM